VCTGTTQAQRLRLLGSWAAEKMSSSRKVQWTAGGGTQRGNRLIQSKASVRASGHDWKLETSDSVSPRRARHKVLYRFHAIKKINKRWNE